MRITIDIDEALFKRAMSLSGIKTKKEMVNTAVREFVERRTHKDLRDLQGAIQFHENYNYKALR